MPSALETLVKILKLERDQGFKDTAVIGGLATYSDNWAKEAHEQARNQDQRAMIDELALRLKTYDTTPGKTERHAAIKYMLDRITGRISPAGVTEPVHTPEQAPIAESGPPASRESGQQMTTKESTRKEQSRGESRDRDKGSKSKARRSGETARRSKSKAAGKLDIPSPPRLARAPRRPRPEMNVDEASGLLAELNEPVTRVKGVGQGMAANLEKLNIQTVKDLLMHLPRRYDDYTRLEPILRLQPDSIATVIGTVRHTEVRIGRGGRKDFFMTLDDGSGVMCAIFFGQHFLQRSIRVGQQIVLSGPTSIYGHQIQMTSPEWEQLDADHLHTIGIVPVYPLTEGLSARSLRRVMKGFVTEWAERIPDHIPEAILERAELGDLGWALSNLHFPEGWDHLEHAKKRLIFDELLLLQLAILGSRRERQSSPGQPLEISDDFLAAFISAVFPYQLTGAQQRAIEDMRRDMSTDIPMNRLLQGDVGSGKTAVAITGIAVALANEKQAAIMAPTSILAEQHYRNIGATLEQMPGERKPVIALLTSALTKSEREAIYRGLADGSIDVVIGTHALIQEGVEFDNLALVVVDEQHRFGVEQRGSLRGKGSNPHLLVMSATPIPRTLALTIYADLDLSIMDEMPPGREPIETRIIDPVARERAYSFIEAQLEQGRQAFIVHPLVEASEQIEAPAAVDAYEHLQQVFFRYRVALLHGRMKAAEKDEIMAAFGNGEFDVLVTTSVAEVGVDIPNASVMMIDGANRFGLAQLHQFRGRVGRGQHASYCLLVSDTVAAEAHERLQAMEETTDGFRLAEIDWQMRGPGDLLGTRQSGHAELHLVAEMTPQLVELAQREARTIYEEDPDLSLPKHRLLAQRVASDYSDFS